MTPNSLSESMIRKTLFLLLFVSFVTAGHGQSKRAPKTKKQTIEAIEGLQFDPVRISMKRGERLELKFVNTDPNDQPHNLVIIEPGSLKAVQEASLKIGADAIEKHYVPDHEAVLASSKLVQADQTETVSFEPEKKGVYQFVCTFPLLEHDHSSIPIFCPSILCHQEKAHSPQSIRKCIHQLY